MTELLIILILLAAAIGSWRLIETYLKSIIKLAVLAVFAIILYGALSKQQNQTVLAKHEPQIGYGDLVEHTDDRYVYSYALESPD